MAFGKHGRQRAPEGPRKVSLRRKLILAAMLVALTGLGYGFARAGTSTGLYVFHRPPSTIAAATDLTLTFSISGDCELAPNASNWSDGGIVNFGAGTNAEYACGPLSAAVNYSVGNTTRTLQAELSAVNASGTRTATVTIPGPHLTPATSFTYSALAQQYRGWAALCMGLDSYYCGSLVALDEGAYTAQARWGPKTIMISGDPSRDAPAAPMLTGNDGGQLSDGVNLSWTQPASNGALITGYKLYRRFEADGEFRLLASLGASQNSFHETQCCLTHRYVIAGVNSFGEGQRSNEVSVRLGLPDSIYLALEARSTGVLVGWPFGDEKAGAITSFKVYRGLDATNLYPIATVDRTMDSSYSFLDTSVVHGTAYYYAVTAINGNGEGVPVAHYIRADLSPPPPPPVITSPVSGSLQTAQVRVQGTAMPGMNVELFVDGSSQAKASTDPAGVWTAYLYQHAMDGNVITIHAVAKNATNGERSGESNRVNVDIDAIAPTGDIDESDETHLGRGQISGVATDNRQATRVVLKYYNYRTGAFVVESVADCVCGSKFATWTDEPDLPSGVYQVSIWVTDLAGNRNHYAGYYPDLLLWEPMTNTAVTCAGSHVNPPFTSAAYVPCTGFAFATERLFPLGADPGSGQGVIGVTAPTGISEGDVYTIDTLPGQSVTVNVSYVASAPEQDIDLFVFKGEGPAFHADVTKSTNSSGVTDSVTFIAQGGTYSIVALGWLIAVDQPYVITTSPSANFVGDDYYLSTYGTTVL